MKYFLSLILMVALSVTSHASNDEQAQLTPSHEQQITTLEIIRKLQNQHFEKHVIDDGLSKKFLDSYLKALDPSKQLFQASEIDALYKKYADKLDDTIKRGDLRPGFDIFNQYRDKNIVQLENTIKNIPKLIQSFTYQENEDIEVDRTEANWPKNAAEIEKLSIQRLKAAALSLKLAKKSQEEIISLLQKRYQNQLDRLKKIRSDDVYQLYMNAFSELYDPHTNYMSPTLSENFDISMRLKLEGIGAVLSTSDEHTQILRLIHAGPAQKQGELKPLDKIVAVAQSDKKFVDVVGWRLDEVVELIRGPKGSTVHLEVIPANSTTDEHKVITIVRDEVKLEEQAVKHAMLDMKDSKGITRKIGVIDIPTFYIDFEALRRRDPNYKSTTRDTAKALSELINQGAEGIIIDLRNNGGGSLREANELTGLFIEKGPSVQIRHTNGRVYTEEKKVYAPFYDGPVVVLINRLSASASEIFAGAMQDYQRAVIVGSPSFGKGTVQSLSELTHGKLKLTESKFYRISGKSTQHKGVLPDIDLPSLLDEKLVGESALDNALPYDVIAPAQHKAYYNLTPIIGEITTLSKQRAANDPEFIYIEKRKEYEQARQSKKLSLNEQQRLRERDNDQKFMLDLLNEKRKAQGLEALSKLDEKDDEDAEKVAAAEDKTNKIDLEDPYLQESAKILLDMDKLLFQLRVAEKNKN